MAEQEQELEREEEEGFDMEGALQEIGEGLGLELSDEEVGGEGGDSEGAGEGKQEALKDESIEGALGDSGNSKGDSNGADQVASAAPATWRSEAKATWATLPPLVQDEILKREGDIFKGIEEYKADANIGRGFKDVLRPYMGVLQQHGIDPIRQVDVLLRAHIALSTAPLEGRVRMFQQLATEYGVDASDIDDLRQVDPTTSRLQEKLNALESKMLEKEQSEFGVKQATLRNELESFASDPKNPYFEEVAGDIAALLRSKVATNLPDAYSKAVWANPVTRAKEQARLQTEQAEAARKLAQDKVAVARQASSATLHTKSKQSRVARNTPLGSIDDTLAETFRAIQSRQ